MNNIPRKYQNIKSLNYTLKYNPNQSRNYQLSLNFTLHYDLNLLSLNLTLFDDSVETLFPIYVNRISKLLLPYNSK
jgi:hypothetical protein